MATFVVTGWSCFAAPCVEDRSIDVEDDTNRGASSRSVLALLLEEAPREMFQEVIRRADPTDRAMLFRVNRACREAVQAACLPRAGVSAGCPLHVKSFTTSLAMIEFARVNLCCPWVKETCAWAAEGGHLEVLQWARLRLCPWNALTCVCAAKHGHLEMLQWARANGCPWDADTCAYAAEAGHLELLKWARARGCPWDAQVTMIAEVYGHREMLEWARANGCPEFDPQSVPITFV